MSQRTRAGKSNGRNTSSKTKKLSNPIGRLTTRSNVQKKNSPSKRALEPSSPAITRRQKRLSGLTAATLLQYCTNILSPSPSNDKNAKSNKRTQRSANPSPSRRRTTKKIKRNSSKQSIPQEPVVPVRSRREASSRASAMIMQQNEIERSRFSYNVTHVSTTQRRLRDKTPLVPPPPPQEDSTSTPIVDSFQFNVPPAPIVPPVVALAPSVTNLSSQTEYAQSSNAITTKPIDPSLSKISKNDVKYSVLTEALLAEHDRHYGTIPSYHTSKRDNLIKWTQELTSYDCMSPPFLDNENSIESEQNLSSNDDSPVPAKVIQSPIPFRTRSFPKEIGALPITNLTVAMMNTFPSTSTTPANLHPLSRSYSFSFGEAVHDHTLLPPTPAYPMDLRPFYSLLPCWQYPGWTFQPATSLVNSIPKPSASSRVTTSKSFTNKPKKSHFKIAAQPVSIISSSKSKQTLLSPRTEALTLHLHTHHHHHHVHNSNGSESPVIPTSVSLSSENLAKDKGIESKSSEKTASKLVQPVHVDETDIPKKVLRRKPIAIQRHARSPTSASRTERRKRTRSSPLAVSRTAVSSSNRKRTQSATSLQHPLSKQKRQKVSCNWNLFGKFERQLVLVDATKPPVYRKCYSSIQHSIEKDIIRSGDCVLLRSDSTKKRSTTPFLAKVKHFWTEPLSGEILMSIIWYYHPDHAELPLRLKDQFLPNELLASKYWDCISVACIEDKCYVLNPHEYNRYCLREKSISLFDHPEPVAKLKSLLNKTTISSNHRSLPGKTIDEQNIFFCRDVYDYRAKRLVKKATWNSNVESGPSTMNQTV